MSDTEKYDHLGECENCHGEHVPSRRTIRSKNGDVIADYIKIEDAEEMLSMIRSHPDLLEACKAALGVFHYPNRSCENGTCTECWLLGDAEDKLRAAIAKAELEGQQ